MALFKLTHDAGENQRLVYSCDQGKLKFWNQGLDRICAVHDWSLNQLPEDCGVHSSSRDAPWHWRSMQNSGNLLSSTPRTWKRGQERRVMGPPRQKEPGCHSNLSSVGEEGGILLPLWKHLCLVCGSQASRTHMIFSKVSCVHLPCLWTGVTITHIVRLPLSYPLILLSFTGFLFVCL